MKNRLLLSRLLRFSLAFGLLLWTLQLGAQCACVSPTIIPDPNCPGGFKQTCSGNFFTLNYCGPDTFYVSSSSCVVTLNIPTGSVNVTPPPNILSFNAALTGYSLGASIPAGEVVVVHYIAQGAMPAQTDTLCFRLVFVDTIPPVITASLADGTFACDVADYAAWANEHVDTLLATSTDNCAVDTVYYSPETFNAGNCGSQVVTFFVVDESGNASTTTATFTTTDNVPPVLVGFPIDTVLFLSCDVTVPAAPAVTATDNCAGALTVNFSETSSQTNNGSCNDNNYTILRTWSAEDACGNSVSTTQTINVEDLTEPDFDIPADTVINCDVAFDTLALGSITNITDNCSAIANIIFNENIINGTCPQERTIVRTWTVEDACLNSRTKTQTIAVQDTVAPVAVFPADITVNCQDAANMNVTGTPTDVSDNCDANPNVTNTDVIQTGICEHEYSVERTWVVTDDCGNAISHVQLINVIDTTAPVIVNGAANLVITCDDAVDADSVFNAWVVSHGSAVATDNCTAGGSLTWLAYNTGTTDPAVLPAADCMNPTIGIYRTQTVDFIVIDKCGNTDTTTATFTVRDDTPPVITDCPQNETITTDPGICEAHVLLPLPMVTEECGNSGSLQHFIQTQFLTTLPGVDSIETPVDDVIFQFLVPGPPYTATGSGTLVISLDNVDAEAPTEFFMAYGEDGTLLGVIANTPVQCGDTTTTLTLTVEQINAWALDGVIEIILKPNIPVGLPGRFSINPICPGGNVTADLKYPANFPVHLRFEYSLNGGPRIPVIPVAPVHEILEQGTTGIAYFFTDCAGNQDSCYFEITVEDKEAPVLDCPPGFTVYLEADECNKDVEVPLFTSVSDNCAVTTPTVQVQPADSLSALITFTYNPNLNDFVADDKVFTFSGLQGDATPGGVKLLITILGDVDSIGAYFEIYDNDNNFLGTTQSNLVTPGDCNSPAVAEFSIPATVFNDWATSGDITITARSFMSYPIPPAGPGWGINPCDPSQVNTDGDTDGSYILATFRYESVSPLFFSTGATTLDPVTLFPPLEPATYTLAQGTTTFHYQVTDLAGNLGECSFDVVVADTIAPTAICGPTFVDINPSGIALDTIFVSEIDLGSFDNCPNITMTVTPSVVTCNNASLNPNPVTLTVTDASGNVSTCNTFVNVTVTVPEPSVIAACGSSTLQFFANPPAAPGAGINPYQYTWYNPQGLPFAYVQNPVILSAGLGELGFYNVVVEGLTGCQSVGVVQVTCDLLPLQKPTVSAFSNIICSSENLILNTTTVCGSTVLYKWYSGNAPGVLMGTTTVPTFSMLPPSSGMFIYYVVVERNGCDSAPSDPVSIQVNATPTATPEQTNIILCEGETILLNSINNPPGSMCSWTGPCGFQSNNCSPAPILNSTSCYSGVYELTVSRTGCVSQPAFVAVNVVPKPAKPTLTNSTTVNTPACNGSQVTLTASNVAGAISYLWTSPMFTTVSTPTNILVLPNADITKDAGQWTVKAIGNACESDVSQPTTVHIVPQPEAVTAAITPTQVCEGQSVQLSATSATQGVTYLWTYPNGQTAATPNPDIANVNNSNNGNYTLVVANQFGCSVQATVQLSVIDRVNITGISSNAPSCVTTPVNVQLVATLFPIDPGNYQYQWTGPGGFFSSNPSANIPNAVAVNSGPYTLVVTNASGCVSLPATVNVAIPEILPTPASPSLNLPNPHCEGDNVTLTTSAYPGFAQYVWTTPTGTYVTTTPSLVLSDLALADAGAYTVNYMVADCPSATSGSMNLVVNPTPIVTPTSNSPVCEGTTLQLGLNCTTGAIYEWTGPGGFSSSVCNPIIPNINPAVNAGTYTIRMRVNGCWSEVVPVNVDVNNKPAIPTAVNAGPYCADTDNVMLSVTGGSATPGAMYTWYNSANEPLGQATPSLNFAVPNPSQYGNTTVEFYVVATISGCNSTPSVPTLVTLNTIPNNQAVAGADIQACEDEIIVLGATPPTIGTGLWTLAGGNPAGIVIANPDQATTTVSGMNPGSPYLFQWTLSNGACKDYSSDQVQVIVDKIEAANAGQPFTVCQATVAELNAVVPLSNIGVWTQPASQASLGITIVNPNNANTLVTGLVPGNSYVFTWTIDGGCGQSSDAVLVTVTNETAFAGADFVVCGTQGEATLNATAALSGVGAWTSPDQTIVFVTPTSPTTTVRNLKTGNNVFVWTINNGACGHLSVDSVIVNFQFFDVNDDETIVPFAGSRTIDVTINDIITGPFTLNILEQPRHGRLIQGIGGEITYEADPNYAGEDSAVYEICQQNCECVSATIKFNVGERADCVVPSIITPNNDGINDAFVIPCLAELNRFPNNIVHIFNQWGDGVFYAKPYQNDWKGTFDGEDLPAGTYFYIVDLGDGSKPMSGYLIIHR